MSRSGTSGKHSFPPLRIGAVNYLNTKPLVYGLEQLAPETKLTFDLPSRLADKLAKREVDVALIPSIEMFQNPAYRVVSDACIACRGPVLSVKLFSYVSPEKIRTLALDEGSRTSVALVRILLKQQFGITPELVSLPIGDALEEASTDAVLLIGDRAIHSPPGRFAEIWDLGDRWCRWSELPFVFAMWTAHADVDTSAIEPALSKARDLGIANLERIADQEAARLGLTQPQCLSYLRDNLYFHAGPRERAGLQLFYQHAVEQGLAPAQWELTYNDCTAPTE